MLGCKVLWSVFRFSGLLRIHNDVYLRNRYGVPSKGCLRLDTHADELCEEGRPTGRQVENETSVQERFEVYVSLWMTLRKLFLPLSSRSISRRNIKCRWRRSGGLRRTIRRMKSKMFVNFTRSLFTLLNGFRYFNQSPSLHLGIDWTQVFSL